MGPGSGRESALRALQAVGLNWLVSNLFWLDDVRFSRGLEVEFVDSTDLEAMRSKAAQPSG